jgi:hypothetical protein
MDHKSLDRMIELGMYKMRGDPWMGEEYIQCDGKSFSSKLAWDELHSIDGQIIHRGELFVVSHQAGRVGMGGMDEGSPASITVYRVK